MPPPVTPSPFRLSRGHPPTRRSAGPQFANSPRFLLSQATPQKGKSDSEIVDDDAPPSTAPVTRTTAQLRQAGPQSRRQRDVIEDSDEDEWLGNADSRDNGVNELADDSIASSPSVDPGTPGPPDAEFDALFAPTRDGNKRQRLSAGWTQGPDQTLANTLEQRYSSVPEPRGSTVDPLETPAARPLQRPTAQDLSTLATPTTSIKPWVPPIATPGSTQTPFRSRPRFVLSTHKPRGSQPAFRAETPSATQQISPQERRRPAFVLPRSPSPDATLDDIPAPFSPSSRTLHRRGKNRSGVGYTPGGMAAEVRSWILEMGSKHEPLSAITQTVATAGHSSTDFGRYLVAARVLQVRSAVLSSSGALSFVRAEKVAITGTEDDEKKILNILIMGPSRSKPPSHGPPSETRGPGSGYIHERELLGIHRGLAWNVTFEEHQALAAANEFQTEVPQGGEPSKAQQWLIAMEWDLVEEAM